MADIRILWWPFFFKVQSERKDRSFVQGIKLINEKAILYCNRLAINGHKSPMEVDKLIVLISFK